MDKEGLYNCFSLLQTSKYSYQPQPSNKPIENLLKLRQIGLQPVKNNKEFKHIKVIPYKTVAKHPQKSGLPLPETGNTTPKNKELKYIRGLLNPSITKRIEAYGLTTNKSAKEGEGQPPPYIKVEIKQIRRPRTVQKK